MKVSLFYESKSINRPREEWYGRGVWNTPQTYIRRIYANAVDNPEYPIPLGYCEWITKQQRPTLRDRWNWITTLSWMVEKGIKIQDAEFYDCTVPDEIVEKILRKVRKEYIPTFERAMVPKNERMGEWTAAEMYEYEYGRYGEVEKFWPEEAKWSLIFEHLWHTTEFLNPKNIVEKKHTTLIFEI